MISPARWLKKTLPVSSVDWLLVDDSTSVQIAVVLISTLDGYPISDYAFELGEKWGVGDRK